MEIDPAILLRLKSFNQTHLISYWDQLDHEQRAILIRDITAIDFDHVTHAFQGIKDQLTEKPVDNEIDEHENKETIDQIMEPVPDNLTGSLDKSSKEQLENYRREGSFIY
jgi:UDP-N-acetylglucosamine/UDP-N-acetylgalactosamine diphosphorylase